MTLIHYLDSLSLPLRLLISFGSYAFVLVFIAAIGPRRGWRALSERFPARPLTHALKPIEMFGIFTMASREATRGYRGLACVTIYEDRFVFEFIFPGRLNKLLRHPPMHIPFDAIQRVDPLEGWYLVQASSVRRMELEGVDVAIDLRGAVMDNIVDAAQAWRNQPARSAAEAA